MSQTIRDCLDHFIGRTVVDVTSHDPKLDGPDAASVTLLFDDGSHLRFPIGGDGVAWGGPSTTASITSAASPARRSRPTRPASSATQ